MVHLNRSVQEAIKGMETTVRNELEVFERWAANNRKLWQRFEELISNTLKGAGSVIQDRKESIIATAGLKYGELLPPNVQIKLDEFLAFMGQTSNGKIPDTKAMATQMKVAKWTKHLKQKISHLLPSNNTPILSGIKDGFSSPEGRLAEFEQRGTDVKKFQNALAQYPTYAMTQLVKVGKSDILLTEIQKFLESDRFEIFTEGTPQEEQSDMSDIRQHWISSVIRMRSAIAQIQSHYQVTAKQINPLNNMISTEYMVASVTISFAVSAGQSERLIGVASEIATRLSNLSTDSQKAIMNSTINGQSLLNDAFSNSNNNTIEVSAAISDYLREIENSRNQYTSLRIEGEGVIEGLLKASEKLSDIIPLSLTHDNSSQSPSK
jgi:hypothetical protein